MYGCMEWIYDRWMEWIYRWDEMDIWNDGMDGWNGWIELIYG